MPILSRQHNEDISDRSNLLDGKNKRNGHLNMNVLGASIGIIGTIDLSMAENKYYVHYREPPEQFITEVHIMLQFKKEKNPLFTMHSLKSVWPKFRAQITRWTLNILGRGEADYL